MKLRRKQNGFVPVVIIVALIVSALLGGFIGFKLGDGTFFSFGIGFGCVLLAAPIIQTYVRKFFPTKNKNE